MGRIIFLFLVFFPMFFFAQTGTLSGHVTAKSKPLPFVNVFAKGTVYGTMANLEGNYRLSLPVGEYQIIAQLQGYRSVNKVISIEDGENIELHFVLLEDALGLEEVVVSATRNRVERRAAPVVVSSLKARILQASQAISVAEGLSFAPGVRVENNCQNCGFTQVRLNGLDGAYTQILLNSRPIFTSLLGVYGLEQIPTNIIERVEVVRSGGSALYGSNAIAGTVNIITKDPIINIWNVGTTLVSIKGEAIDRIINFNSSTVADDLKTGFTLYGNYRNREPYDANKDGFTEIVALRNTTIGSKAFLRPSDLSRLSIQLNVIQEYRRGGDRLNLAPQFTDITEELDHDAFMGGVDYEQRSEDGSKNLQIYTSASFTLRESYYGGLGGGRTRMDSITANNAFGETKDMAWVNGLQFTKKFAQRNVLTLGTEYNIDATEDGIVGYNRLIDQRVHRLSGYGQFEWKPVEKFTALFGGRLDWISVDGVYEIGAIKRGLDLSQAALSPRLTLSYQFAERLKWRGGYARGFRAPQAFNEDLHISSVGGEQQFVILSEDLKTEYSNAYTTSFNYVLEQNLCQVDVLVEGFYTSLENPFTLVSTGAGLANGSIIEDVRNGSGASVYGSNFELGISPNPKWTFQLGGTYQKTRYDNIQLLFESDGTPGEPDIFLKSFVRVPDLYGYFNTSWIPSKKFNIDLTGTYNGRMTVPRVVSSSGFMELKKVDSFFDLNIKLEKHVDFDESFMITLSAGVTNLFDSYQNDFEVGPTRDSDYVYGPDAPRAFFFGLKFGKLH